MSRLYPGWGTGKSTFEEVLSVYSVTSFGRSDLESGDKVVLPSSTFKKVTRLRLPFPLTFHAANAKVAASSFQLQKQKVVPAKPIKEKMRPVPMTNQYCGVMEFSAPEGRAYIPKWMMSSLRVKEGGKVAFKSVLDGSIAKGTLCRLQPHSSAFLDLAASMDLRDLLECAFRNYSVLSTGEKIVVNIAGENYKINVVETQPEPAISLYGSLDLEVDFAPPLDKPDVRKKKGPATNAKIGVEMDPPVPNQLPSPKFSAGEEQARAQEPQGHQWGQGHYLVNSMAGAQIFDSQSVTSKADKGGSTSRIKRRNPSKFASRITGSSFIGNATSLSGGTPMSEKKEATQIATKEHFSGEGRRLSSAEGKSADLDEKEKHNAQSIREKRLQFLARLQQTSKNGDLHHNSDRAVGSGLNAIRGIASNQSQ